MLMIFTVSEAELYVSSSGVRNHVRASAELLIKADQTSVAIKDFIPDRFCGVSQAVRSGFCQDLTRE